MVGSKWQKNKKENGYKSCCTLFVYSSCAGVLEGKAAAANIFSTGVLRSYNFLCVLMMACFSFGAACGGRVTWGWGGVEKSNRKKIYYGYNHLITI